MNKLDIEGAAQTVDEAIDVLGGATGGSTDRYVHKETLFFGKIVFRYQCFSATA